MSIPRGTTPVNFFKVPLDLSEAEVVYLTYDQLDRTVIEKEKSDMTFDVVDDVHWVSVLLSQEDTLALNSKHPVDMEIRARYPGGLAVKSRIMRTTVDRVLKDGVI